MRRIWVVLLLIGAISCTPHQQRLWLRWWHQEPKAAVSWAVHECGDLCTIDWDRDGVVEPEPVAETDTSPVSDESDYSGGEDSAGAYSPWTAIAECESGGNWSADTGNGYYGGLQFALGSWQAVGGSGNPADASPSEQIYRAGLLLDQQGWSAWPTCARELGLL